MKAETRLVTAALLGAVLPICLRPPLTVAMARMATDTTRYGRLSATAAATHPGADAAALLVRSPPIGHHCGRLAWKVAVLSAVVASARAVIPLRPTVVVAP